MLSLEGIRILDWWRLESVILVGGVMGRRGNTIKHEGHKGNKGWESEGMGSSESR